MDSRLRGNDKGIRVNLCLSVAKKIRIRRIDSGGAYEYSNQFHTIVDSAKLTGG